MAKKGAASNVKVVCRFRPPNSREQELAGANAASPPLVFSKDGTSCTVHNELGSGSNELQFTFDKIFASTAVTQDEVYEFSAKPAVADALEGFNSTIFAYGQTGAGKTFSMMGTKEHPGIIPHAIGDIFQTINAPDNTSQFTITASYVEIYNEMVHDLLNPAQTNLKVRECT